MNKRLFGVYDLDGFTVARLSETEAGDPHVLLLCPSNDGLGPQEITMSGPDAVAGLIKLVTALRQWAYPQQNATGMVDTRPEP